MNSLVLYETFVSVVRRRIAPPRSAVRAPADVWAWVAMAMDSFVVSYEPGDASRSNGSDGHRCGWAPGACAVASEATRLLTSGEHQFPGVARRHSPHGADVRTRTTVRMASCG